MFVLEMVIPGLDSGRRQSNNTFDSSCRRSAAREKPPRKGAGQGEAGDFTLAPNAGSGMGRSTVR